MCCGYPPFYSEHNDSISPGMKKKIRAGDYKFPEREWSKISINAKNLIEKMIIPAPEKRLTINEIMENKWICVMMKIFFSFLKHFPINIFFFNFKAKR
jgi:serine/threonine protein kinase